MHGIKRGYGNQRLRDLEILKRLDLGYFESGLLMAVPEAHNSRLWAVLLKLLMKKSSGMIINEDI
jgi:hypothetical protein